MNASCNAYLWLLVISFQQPRTSFQDASDAQIGVSCVYSATLLSYYYYKATSLIRRHL